MKDTCKQAIFRKDTRRVRRAEDPLRAGDREERELEFFNKVKDILRMYHSSSWHSEPDHLNGDTGPLRLGPSPSLIELVYLPITGCSA